MINSGLIRKMELHEQRIYKTRLRVKLIEAHAFGKAAEIRKEILAVKKELRGLSHVRRHTPRI